MKLILQEQLLGYIDHDIVLGSTAAGTLELRHDAEGLPGTIRINQKDTDAMNAYARCERGDVSGCSFGFDCVFDDFVDSDGTYRTVIREVTQLYEVSPCTFPAYESTTINARDRMNDLRNKNLAEWKARMKGMLKDGTEDPNAQKEA